MTAKQLISLGERHHIRYWALGKDDEPDIDEHWNIEWLLRPAHKQRTPGDNKAIKKVTRSIRKRQKREEQRQREAAIVEERGEEARPNRSPGGLPRGAKVRSRNTFQQREKKACLEKLPTPKRN